MTEIPRDALEERVAHLDRAVADLSDEVARRGQEIDRLTKLVEMLMSQERERQADTDGALTFTDRPPPHW